VEFTLDYHTIFCHVPGCASTLLAGSQADTHTCMEKKRHSRLITLIHRQESVALWGLPIARYITMEDSEAVLTAIRSTPPDTPLT